MLHEIPVRLREHAEWLRSDADDAYFNISIVILVAEIEREGFHSLRQQAEATATDEDDRVIQQLADIDHEKQQ